MFKLFILIGAFSASSSSFGESSKNLITCVTEAPTTSYVLNKLSDDHIRLTVIHHNGVEHAPLYHGTMTQYSSQKLDTKFAYVKNMGSRFSVDFNKKNCKFEQDRTSCYESNSLKIGDQKIKTAYFMVYKQISITPFGDFTEYNARFDYRIESKSHSIPMTFQKSECKFNK